MRRSFDRDSEQLETVGATWSPSKSILPLRTGGGEYQDHGLNHTTMEYSPIRRAEIHLPGMTTDLARTIEEEITGLDAWTTC